MNARELAIARQKIRDLPGWRVSFDPSGTGECTITSPQGALFLPPDYKTTDEEAERLLDELNDRMGLAADAERRELQPARRAETPAPTQVPAFQVPALPTTTPESPHQEKESEPVAATTAAKPSGRTRPKVLKFIYPDAPQTVPLSDLLPPEGGDGGKRYMLPAVIIDVDTATAFLERAALERNRKLRRGNVTKFRRLLASGQIAETHQGLAFNERGHLSDGQHRMAGLVEEGQINPDLFVVMDITYNMPIDSATAYDGGAPRTNIDHLLVAGVDNAQVVARLARLLYLYTETVGKAANWRDVPILTPEGIIEWSKKYGEELSEAYKNTRKISGGIGLNPSAGALFYYLAKQADPAAPLDEFMAGMADMEFSYADDPRKTLMRWLRNAPDKRVDIRHHLAHIIQTYNDWRLNLPRQLNKWVPTWGIPQPYTPDAKPPRNKRKKT